MAIPAVELQHVTKCFAKVVANHDVSLAVYPGEVVALLVKMAQVSPPL